MGLNYFCEVCGSTLSDFPSIGVRACIRDGCKLFGVADPKNAIATGANTKDPINPDHYKFGGIETIDYMKAKMTPEGFEGYLQGNVIKYTSRYAHKNGLEDLEKAQWYLTKLIEVYGRFKT